MLCSTLPLLPLGLTRGWRRGDGLRYSSPPPSPPSLGLARGRRGGGGLLAMDYSSPPLSPPPPGPAPGWWVSITSSHAPPTADLPPPSLPPLPLTLHLHHHTPCQTQGFPRERFFPRGAAGAYIHLTLSHASYRLLTCLIVHRLGRTPAAYHHGRRRRHWSRHDEAYSPPSHQQHCHAAGAFLMSRWTPGMACPPGAAAVGDVGYWTAQPPLPPPFPSPPLHPFAKLTAHAHTHTPTHTHTHTHLRGPWPSLLRGQALLDRGTHHTSSDTIDQAPLP
jgi:hypothetical protein